MSTSHGLGPDGPSTTELDVDAPREVARERLVLTEELSLCSVPYSRFAALVIERALPHTSWATWPCESRAYEPLLPFALATHRGQHVASLLLDLEPLLARDGFAHVYLGEGAVTVHVAAFERDLIDDAESWLRERYPRSEPRDETVPMRLWSLGDRGSRAIVRRIAVPDWDEIAGNYARPVRVQLERLCAPTFRPDAAGQLVLWHGEPGTGKTHALRALAWAWRGWCEVHYVTDPEAFFGQSSYMLDVLLRKAEDDEDDEDGEDAARWRLLVLEDAGELLSADAKERTGQGLSRLLNVVDGIIGQGLRVVVLVTTNEPLRRLHPAVSRPGRCAASVEFGPLAADEADDWLRRNGLAPAGHAALLAHLYARASGAETPSDRRPVGFSSA
ncbi:MAG: AAA family ATPase [Gaiellaceae bacterium]